MATFDEPQLILVNFEELSLNCYVLFPTPKGDKHSIIRPLMVQYDLI